MRRLVFIAAAALAISACGAFSSSDIEGHWQLTSGEFDGQAVTLIDDHPITLSLVDGELSGTAACNGYGGSYTFAAGALDIGEVVWTEMACSPREVMDSEQEYLSIFLTVDFADFIGDELVLTGPMASLTFEPLEKQPPIAGDEPPEQPAALFGPDTYGSWELLSGESDGEPIPMVASHPITLAINDESVGGTAACNGYGRFAGEDGGFSVTEMACSPSEVMDSESAYLDALVRVSDSAVEANGRLILTGDGVEMEFRALESVPEAELLNTVWVLDGLIQGDAVSSPSADTRATLELFSDGSFIGSTGCRTIAGSYQVSGSEVVFTNWGAEGDCSPEMADQDSKVISALEGGFRVEISEDRLTTWVAGDEGLVYRAER